MDLDTLIKPEMQNRVREMISRMMIERNMTLKQVAIESLISMTMAYHFFNNRRRAGKEVMKRLAHFLLKNGYTLEQITTL